MHAVCCADLLGNGEETEESGSESDEDEEGNGLLQDGDTLDDM